MAGLPRLCPEGATLQIDLTDYESRFLSGPDAMETFSPMSVWEALQADYGGEQGAEAAYSQIAQILVRKFHVEKGRPFETKAGRTILNLSVWLDSFDKKMGKNRLSISCRDDVCTVLKALAGFMAWSGMDADDAQQAVHPWIIRFGDSRYNLESRSRHAVAEGLAIATYQNRFEFHFHGNLGEQLPVFLSLYGLQFMRGAAA